MNWVTVDVYPLIFLLKLFWQQWVGFLAFRTELTNFLKPECHLTVVANKYQLIQPNVLQTVPLFSMHLQP